MVFLVRKRYFFSLSWQNRQKGKNAIILRGFSYNTSILMQNKWHIWNYYERLRRITLCFTKNFCPWKNQPPRDHGRNFRKIDLTGVQLNFSKEENFLKTCTIRYSFLMVILNMLSLSFFNWTVVIKSAKYEHSFYSFVSFCHNMKKNIVFSPKKTKF